MSDEEFSKLRSYTRWSIANHSKSSRFAELNDKIAEEAIMSIDENSDDYHSMIMKLYDLNIGAKLSVKSTHKLIQLVNKVIDKNKDELANPKKDPIGRSKSEATKLINTILMRLNFGAKLPELVDMYSRLLPYINTFDNYDFISNLASLGKSGEIFLPFLKEKLEKEKDEYKAEFLNYVIDSIESGQGFSKKYRR